jgi:hypothetical protein
VNSTARYRRTETASRSATLCAILISVICAFAVYNTRAQAAAQPDVFTWNDDIQVGDCHTLPGARLELSPAPNGYTLHYVAQMRTDKSVFGDVWQVTWHFMDSAGNVILTSPQIDLPDNGARMHPQFGVNNIDHTSWIGPDTEPHISQVIDAIQSVKSDNSC